VAAAGQKRTVKPFAKNRHGSDLDVCYRPTYEVLFFTEKLTELL